MSFNPNHLTFDQGISRIKDAYAKAKVARVSGIATSRDPEMQSVSAILRVENVPPGFKKWQLPVFLDGPSQLFVSVGDPDTVVPPHSHDEGDGLRYIVSGSVIYNGKELTQGDWMFIPKGKKYDMTIGPRGATMMYCYRCCCA